MTFFAPRWRNKIPSNVFECLLFTRSTFWSPAHHLALDAVIKPNADVITNRQRAGPDRSVTLVQNPLEAS